MGTVSDNNNDMSTENHKQKTTRNWSQRRVIYKHLVLGLKQALRSAGVVSLEANSLFLCLTHTFYLNSSLLCCPGGKGNFQGDYKILIII